MNCKALLAIAVLSASTLYAQTSTTAVSYTEFKGFDSQAHRGSRGLLPESTIPAMIDAIDRGMTTLEMDLQVSKDQQVLVSHDAYFNEKITTLPDGSYLTAAEARKRLLYTMTYDSISKYDVGLKDFPDFPEQKRMAAHKPLLKDLLAATEAHAKKVKHPVYYNIEIKSRAKHDGIEHPAVEQYVDLALEVIANLDLKDRVVIQSFDNRALQVVHRKYPEVATSLLIESFDLRTCDQMLTDLGFTPVVFSPHHTKVTAETLRFWHAKNVRVVPWSINDINEMKRLKKLGVDGIISDYPDRLSKI